MGAVRFDIVQVLLILKTPDRGHLYHPVLIVFSDPLQKSLILEHADGRKPNAQVSVLLCPIREDALMLDLSRQTHPCPLTGPERPGVRDLEEAWSLDRGGALQGLFPEMPRREVAYLKRQWVRDHRSGLYHLEWTQPGAVWALDHARPDGMIIGVERALWAVRDLASHNQLVWCPVLNMTAQAVRTHLVDLFLGHGAPLAIKMDNGTLATDEDLTEILNSFGVIRLVSPVYTPPYNGSCEASIGWMKIRTRHQAGLDGCPEVWTREHCEAARRSANEISRPWGPCPSIKI